MRVTAIAIVLASIAMQQIALASPEPRESSAWPGGDALRLPRVIADEPFVVRVPIANDGADTWSSWTEPPVRLAYHWLGRDGRALVWDGKRTPLDNELAPGGERLVSAIVRPPAIPGDYELVFDLVREGVGWLGKTLSAPVTVEPALYRAKIVAADAPPALVGTTRQLALSIKNEGNVPWRGSGPGKTAVAYHWFDSSGKRLVEWDGARTPLDADVAPGATAAVELAVTMPKHAGVYTLAPDLVRDGIGWLSGSPATLAVRATTDLNAEWERTSTPAAISPGAHMPVDVVVQNVGLATWRADGPHPARIAYHWYDENGNVAEWDGARQLLREDVAPGRHVSVLADVVAPSAPGVYELQWDVVAEGVGWASQQSGTSHRDTVVVEPGVTFYGKGWGHGVGLSQWGAQGWAEGAVGERLTGEEIAAKYYPGTTISTLPADSAPIRVLLSEPSTGCVASSISNVAHVRARSGLRLQRGNDTIALVDPGHTLRVSAYGGSMSIVDVDSGAPVYDGGDELGIFARDSGEPMAVDEKGLAYRDKIVVAPAGGALRVVSVVTPEEYMRGSLPGEMPARWEMEALRAQALAGLSFALWRQSGMRHMPYDLRDDISDQCYGGAGFESPRTDAAVASTAGRYLSFEGRPVRAYYSASNGGAIESNACVWDVDRSRDGLACGTGEPYLRQAPDPADLAATDSRGANPHRLWSETFTGTQMRWLAYEASGVDVGEFVSVDLSNRSPSGYVVSVKVNGTAGSVEIRGGYFLRGILQLDSSLVRLEPF